MVSRSGPNNTIGGTGTFERNVISGNGTNGILVYGSAASGNLIEGNYIGTKASGTAALANGGGFDHRRAEHKGWRNRWRRELNSGNAGVAVSRKAHLLPARQFKQTSLALMQAARSHLPNHGGIGIGSSNNTIGGSGAGMGNVVSGNTDTGIALSASPVTPFKGI